MNSKSKNYIDAASMQLVKFQLDSLRKIAPSKDHITELFQIANLSSSKRNSKNEKLKQSSIT